MKTVLALAAYAIAAAATAQQVPPPPFGVAGVRLGMSAAAVPEPFRKDCQPLKSKPTVVFCSFLTEASGVPLSVELALTDDRVNAIYVHFPRAEYQTVWLALRERYGKEHERAPNKVHWYSGPHAIEDPIPDELTLIMIPDQPPFADGTYIKEGVEYAALEYVSMAKVREQAARREQERKRKLKDLAEKL